MINVQPTHPDCVMATHLRFEFPQSDLDLIARDMGIEKITDADMLTAWTMSVIDAKMKTLGSDVISTDFSKEQIEI